jgi:hypothetical protein
MSTNKNAICTALEEEMLLARRSAEEHERQAASHKTIAEQERIRESRFRDTILDLAPDYGFNAAPIVADGAERVLQTQERPAESPHKKNYGKWVKVAELALVEVGGEGDYAAIVAGAKKAMPELAQETDDEFNKLRSALHGLRKRNKIDYTAGEGGRSGVFRLLGMKRHTQ